MKRITLLIAACVMAGCGTAEKVLERRDMSRYATITGIAPTLREAHPESRVIEPTVGRLVLLGVDHREVKTGIIRVSTWNVMPGRRVLTILGEDLSGRETVSFIAVDLKAGRDYELVPRESDQGLLAEVIDRRDNSTLGLSSVEPVRLRDIATEAGPQRPY